MLKKSSIQQNLLFLRCKNGIKIKNLKKKKVPKQYEEIEHQYSKNEKVGKKKIFKLQNFHIQASGNNYQSYKESLE